MSPLPFTPQEAHQRTPADSLRSDARRNRAAILDAANSVFAEIGADAGLDRVAARAGVGVGTVYRHFPTKVILAGALLAERYEAMRVQVERIATQADPAFDRLIAALEANGTLVHNDSLARHTLNHGGPGAHIHAEPARLALEAEYAPLLAEARADGSLRDDFVLADVGRLMTAICATMDDSGSQHWRHILAIAADGLRIR